MHRGGGKPNKLSVGEKGSRKTLSGGMRGRKEADLSHEPKRFYSTRPNGMCERGLRGTGTIMSQITKKAKRPKGICELKPGNPRGKRNETRQDKLTSPKWEPPGRPI